jgi:hypothetical protein
MYLVGTLITQKKNSENAVLSYYEMRRKELQNTLNERITFICQRDNSKGKLLFLNPRCFKTFLFP